MKRHDDFLWNLPGAAKAHKVFICDLDKIDIDQIVTMAAEIGRDRDDLRQVELASKILESVAAKSLLSTESTNSGGYMLTNINFGTQNFFLERENPKKSHGTIFLNTIVGAVISLLPGWAKMVLAQIREKFL